MSNNSTYYVVLGRYAPRTRNGRQRHLEAIQDIEVQACSRSAARATAIAEASSTDPTRDLVSPWRVLEIEEVQS